MCIQHNLSAMFTNRQLGNTRIAKKKSTEKLASGFKINRAADNAAGLSISEKMRWQIRGLNRASQNIQDGISYIQVAEGALDELHAISQRVRELCVQAANDSNTKEDREALQKEITALANETGRICTDTEFNTQKIWDTAYIPYVTGSPRELKVYNEGFDHNGNIIYGGIIWGEERYAWDSIDPNMYDSSTNTFRKGDYKIDVPSVNFNTTNDTYMPNGNTTTLFLTVDETGRAPVISRECDWSADSNGITMDGVLYKWSELENQKDHSKSFNPSDIKAGNWGFNTFNGTHVWFEIPENDGNSLSLQNVIDKINGTRLDHLEWKIDTLSIQNMPAVGVVPGTLTQEQPATIWITQANKDIVTRDYTLHADRNGVWAENNNGTNLGKETWASLGMEKNGKFQPPHNTSDHKYYDDSPEEALAPDSHNKVVSHSHYTTEGKGYNSSVLSGLDTQFTVLQEAGKQAVINGIDGAVIKTSISTPTKVTASHGNTSGKVSSASGNAKLTFDFHKQMGRDFNDEKAFIGTGSILLNASGYIEMQVVNGGNTLTLTSATSRDSMLSTIKSILGSTNGGNLSFSLKDNTGNAINLTYNISALTAAERQSITNGTKSLSDYALAVRNDIFQNNSISLQADGYAVQTLTHSNYTSTMGIAQRNGNIANYTSFSTEIAYMRQLRLQTGALGFQSIDISYRTLNKSVLGLGNISVNSYTTASIGIDYADRAISIISEERSRFGAYQNRLEHAKSIDENSSENTQNAESKIRDTDFAKEMTELSKHNILEQVGQSMLSQANQSAQSVISLLQ